MITVHIVGENDNFGRTPEMDAEHLERKAANIAWLKQAFAEAKAANARGVVILTQANPGFENFWPAASKAPLLPALRPARAAGAEPAAGVRRLRPDVVRRVG